MQKKSEKAQNEMAGRCINGLQRLKMKRWKQRPNSREEWVSLEENRTKD
jgi:hypothetical protein